VNADTSTYHSLPEPPGTFDKAPETGETSPPMDITQADKDLAVIRLLVPIHK